MKSRQYSVKIFIAAIILIIVVIFLNNSGYLNSTKSLVYRILNYPISKISKIGFGANGVLGFISEIKNLRQERNFLFEENNLLRKEVADLKELKYENELLRTTLGLSFYKEQALSEAVIIGRDSYSFLNYLIINQGAESGIKDGMNVVDNNGFFVGTIYETDRSSAKVRTILDISTNISGIDQESRVKGIIKGDLNEGLIFDMVSQDAAINAGDTIIAAPTAENNKMQPAAKIISVEKYPNKPFLKIKLSPLANIKNVEKIFVIIK